MNQTPIIKLYYKKNPRLKAFLTYPVYFLVVIYALCIGLANPSSNNFLNEIIFFTFLFSILILMIMIKYMPISDSLDKYKSFDIYDDCIVINNTDNFSLKNIRCEINAVSKGGKIPAQNGMISASWISLVLYDESKKIAEFFFEIATENDFFDLTAERVKQLIEDIQKKNIINYDQRIQKDIEASKEDKKDENTIGIIILLFTLIPISAGVAIYFMTR